MNQSSKWFLTAGAMALLLAGCGGGGGGSSSTDTAASGATTGGTGTTTDTTAAAPQTDQFTKKASWTVTAPAAGTQVCYDFDTATEVSGCTGNTWDVSLTGGARSVTLGTNSGVNGSGSGGVFAGEGTGLIDWTTLQTWKSGLYFPTGDRVPLRLYFPDVAQNAFTGTNEISSAIYEYGLNGGHLMYPSYRVFLITTDSSNNSTTGTAASPVFALQVTGYYGGAGGTTSGHPSFRWVDRSGAGAVREATVDASAGWVYFDLISGTTSSESGTWHIAFNRYSVRVNGGSSGSGSSAAYLALTPDDLYTDNGSKPVASALVAAKPENYLSYLTSAQIPATVQRWQTDGKGSYLNPSFTELASGAYDFGLYTYYPTAALAEAAGLTATAHVLGANPAKGALVRGGEGSSYARMRLSKIEYADAANARSPQTWTFEFDVQPAAQ